MTTLKSESQARCGEHRTRSRQAVPNVSLKLNEVEVLRGSTPWILDEFEANVINKAYKGEPLESLVIEYMGCKS